MTWSPPVGKRATFIVALGLEGIVPKQEAVIIFMIEYAVWASLVTQMVKNLPATWES